MFRLFTNLDLHTGLLLIFTLSFFLFYEVINGFHDTANAVAIIIYTRIIHAQIAVIMAAIFNFFGVLFGGLSVAYTIVHMLPADLLLNIRSCYGLTMIFSLLFTTIIWNLSTWYFGLPTSSSHTLIGAIIGIGLTNATLTNISITKTLNLSKIISIFISLIASPVVGLVIAGGLIYVLRYWNNKKQYTFIHLTPTEQEKKYNNEKPTFWTRITLIFSAIGVAFSHGANDGQKSIGLIMLMFIGISPENFVVNMNASNYEISQTRNAIYNLETYLHQHPVLLKKTYENNKIIQTAPWVCQWNSINMTHALIHAKKILNNIHNYNTLTVEERSQIRHTILYISDILDQTEKLQAISNNDQIFLKKLKKDMLNTIEYAPIWIVIAIATALGIGTMIGWKRITITYSKKIGKKELTYAQCLSAQLTATISISFANYIGLPVSTTHVLSSSITGTIIVEGGGIQSKTIINILLAWMLTLPISIGLSSGLYWFTLKIF